MRKTHQNVGLFKIICGPALLMLSKEGHMNITHFDIHQHVNAIMVVVSQGQGFNSNFWIHRNNKYINSQFFTCSSEWWSQAIVTILKNSIRIKLCNSFALLSQNKCHQNDTIQCQCESTMSCAFTGLCKCSNVTKWLCVHNVMPAYITAYIITLLYKFIISGWRRLNQDFWSLWIQT